MADELLDRVVEAVLAGQKYRCVSQDVIRRIGAGELTKRRGLKDAIKATKNKLHQIGGAFLDNPPDYRRALDTLDQATDREAFRAACHSVMDHHASTRERLPILDEFYAVTLADVAPVRSVLDVACGLNPLAIPWMPLAPEVTYNAVDIYHDMIDFINGFLPLAGTAGRAEARDVIQWMPPERVQVALILKTIPCLEQVDKLAGRWLLEMVQADHLLVSFPVRSLGGYDKGMAATYTDHLYRLLDGKPWPVKRFEFETELAFLITKHGDPMT